MAGQSPTPRFQHKSIYACPHSGEATWRYQGSEKGVMRVQMLPEAAAREEDLTKSLRIASDDRYKSMEYYRGKTKNEGHKQDHFSRLKARNSMVARRSLSMYAGGALGVDGELPEDGDRMSPLESLEEEPQEVLRLPAAAPLDRVQVRQVGIGDRAEWQDTFDRSVRRLFVDFELSDVPSCRLNHLDRMHSWFLEHGAKQQRKVREGPSFLVADRSSEAPAGSTRNVPVKQVERPLVTGFTSGISRPASSPHSSRWQRPGNLTSR
jgi:hypothetical protein